MVYTAFLPAPEQPPVGEQAGRAARPRRRPTEGNA
jgi:hypothetical protein